MTALADLRALAEQARDRTWDGDVVGSWLPASTFREDGYVAEDAAFIAACDPQTVLGLLDERDAQKKVVEAAQDFLVPRKHWKADENFPYDQFIALRDAVRALAGLGITAEETSR